MSIKQNFKKANITNVQDATACQVTCNYKIAKIILPKPPIFNIKPPPSPIDYTNITDLIDPLQLQLLYENRQYSSIGKSNCLNTKKYFYHNDGNSSGLRAIFMYDSTSVSSNKKLLNNSTFNFNNNGHSDTDNGIKDTNLFLILLICCILLITILVIFIFCYFYLNRKPFFSNRTKNSNENSLTKSSSTTLTSHQQQQQQQLTLLLSSQPPPPPPIPLQPPPSMMSLDDSLINQYRLNELTFIPVNNTNNNSTTSGTTTSSSYEYCTKNLFKKLLLNNNDHHQHHNRHNHQNGSCNNKNYEKLCLDSSYYNTLNGKQIYNEYNQLRTTSDLSTQAQLIQLQQTQPILLTNIYENNNHNNNVNAANNDVMNTYQQLNILNDLNSNNQQNKCFIYLQNTLNPNDFELKPLILDNDSILFVKPVIITDGTTMVPKSMSTYNNNNNNLTMNGSIYDRIDETSLLTDNQIERQQSATPLISTFNRSNNSTMTSSSNKRKYPKTNPNYKYI